MKFRPQLRGDESADANPSADLLHAHLSAVYALAQGSRHVFASPLGPIRFGARHAYLPRFVFFGPHASDESWRLAFLAGFDRRDLRPAHAVLALIQRLAAQAETGHGLHLTFFPLVDAAGAFLGAPDRGLAGHHWGRSPAPEIGLLEKEIRQASYHGFIRVETAPAGEEAATIRLVGAVADHLTPDLELITTEDIEPFPVRFEVGPAGPTPTAGPLSVVDDLAVAPFELDLRIPGSWSDDLYQRAVGVLLQRFLWRYRAFQAYGQNL
jgi:hypothetical protein